MKIGILSMQRIPNMGSVIQAYGLKKILNSMGHEIYFIDIEPNHDEDLLMKDSRMIFHESGEKNGIIKKQLSRIDCYFFYKLLHKFEYKKQLKKYDNFREKYLDINNVYNGMLDYCIIGSDEVFNAAQDAPWGYTSQLFGNVKQANRIITYAASCGATREENLPSLVKNSISYALNKLSSISVRDNNTANFVSKLLPGKEIDYNLDPAFISDFTDEINNANVSWLPDHYCLVYAYKDRIHNKIEMSTIKNFCKRKKLTLITIQAPQKWIRKYRSMSPFEALNVFEKADFVITDTFHGTIFSSKYSKKFMTIVRDSNREKLSDLIERIGIQAHRAECITDDILEKHYLIENDFDKIESIRQTEFEKTKEYFLRNLV